MESWFLGGEDGEATWSGEGKYKHLRAWGENQRGETEKARWPEKRITGLQDNRITRTAKITDTRDSQITEQGSFANPHSLVAPKGPADQFGILCIDAHEAAPCKPRPQSVKGSAAADWLLLAGCCWLAAAAGWLLLMTVCRMSVPSCCTA